MKQLLLFLLPLFLLLPHHHAYALCKDFTGIQITSPGAQGGYQAYNIYVDVKINGHPIRMLLDTGSDFSVVSGQFVSQLGLDNAPASAICGEGISMTSMSGQSSFEHATDVQMCIENTKCFTTPILLNPQQQTGIHGAPDAMLSAHDLYQAYRLQFIPIH